MTDPLAALNAAGVSIWLDDLSRERLTSGSLADLVARTTLLGSPPTPPSSPKAISGEGAYGVQIRVCSCRREAYAVGVSVGCGRPAGIENICS